MKRFLAVLLIILIAAPFIKAQQFLYQNSCSVTDRYGKPLRSILSSDGKILQPVSLSDISPWVILAVMSAEDKRFFEHNGVDVKAVARASWQNITEGGVVSGASTITQQLVRAGNPRSKNLAAKIKEAYKAIKLEGDISKEEILEAYLNSVNLGGNIHGFEAASQIYFHVSAGQLSLSQAAFLAGIIKSPYNYNPYKKFNNALKRRDFVLAALLKNGYINEELYQNALSEKITVYPFSNPFTAPHYSEFILSKIPSCKGRIQTTIDGNLQAYLEKIVPIYLHKLADNNVSNAAVVVLDNKSGEVLAMLGSADYFDAKNNGYINGALALRQPGSALKPFVYALAFEGGALPYDKVLDEDKFFPSGYRPRNYDGSFHGIVTLREALACSYNIPAVSIAQKTGVENILNKLRQAGFVSLDKTADDYGLGLSLGNGEVRLLELANAYRMFANKGFYSPVKYSLSPEVKESAPSAQVFTPQSSFMITDILSDNNARAAAFGLNSPLNMPFAFASKTGTSKDYRDNTAIGYSPKYTIAVWTGNFDGKPMRRVSGISGAAPLLRDIAAFLNANYKADTPSAFDKPKDIIYLDICPVSNKLASKNCPKRIREVFTKNNQPSEHCSLTDKQHQQDYMQENPGIISPQQGDAYRIDPAFPAAAQQIAFKHSLAGKADWFLNGQKLTCPPNRCFWPLTKGSFKLELKAPGFYESVSFSVI